MISAFDKEIQCNSLIGILKECEGRRIQIDLRNELHVFGKVESIFGDMNVIMSNAYIFTPAFDQPASTGATVAAESQSVQSSARQPKFYNEITLRGRNIRFVHVPDEIDMIAALQNQIRAVTRPNLKKQDKKQFKIRPRNRNNSNASASDSKSTSKS